MTSLSTLAGTLNPKSFRTERTEVSQTLRDTYKNGVFQNTSSPAFAVRDIIIDEYQGRILKDYHKRKNSGELLPMTSYRNIRHEIDFNGPSVLTAGFTHPTNGDVMLYEYYWIDHSTRPLNPFGILQFSTEKYSQMYDILTNLGVNPDIFVQKAASNLYSKGWDGLTFAAELHKLLRVIELCCTQILKILDDYQFFFKRNKTLTIDKWLEGRYAWRILLYDLEDLRLLISLWDSKVRSRNKTRSGENFTYEVDNSVTYLGTHQITVNDITSFDVGVRGSIIADFVPARITLNPVLTAWELVRFSFVVDWIVNVGQAIAALSFITTNGQYTAATGIALEATRNVSVDVSFTGSWLGSGHSTWDQLSVYEHWTVNERIPKRVPYLPFLQVNLSDVKVVDLIALILQAIARLSRR